jgi:hypothetical protein
MGVLPRPDVVSRRWHGFGRFIGVVSRFEADDRQRVVRCGPENPVRGVGTPKVVRQDQQVRLRADGGLPGLAPMTFWTIRP